MALGRKLRAIGIGLWHASGLNMRMSLDKLRGRRTAVFHVGAASQFMHIETVIHELAGRESGSRIAFYVLTKGIEMPAVRAKSDAAAQGIVVKSEKSSRLLLFCDFFLSVDQGMVFPYLGCKTRACCFHGQPSKGNVYQRFNYRQINALFFYGPLMKSHYLEAKGGNPHWPAIACHDVGQPLSDRRFNQRQDRASARTRLGLDPSTYTVIYAPSFEYCSSLATHGSEIIEALLETGINVIVKPHPVFYNSGPLSDPFNVDIPNAGAWRDRMRLYDSKPNCVFPQENTLDAAVSLSAADAMLTDYSGIAFDGILLDMEMIFWDCPQFYSEYLPKRYGVDGEKARSELACNVGREAGDLVGSIPELVEAIEACRANPDRKRQLRKRIGEKLLFNPGRATQAMADRIEGILGVESR